MPLLRKEKKPQLVARTEWPGQSLGEDESELKLRESSTLVGYRDARMESNTSLQQLARMEMQVTWLISSADSLMRYKNVISSLVMKQNLFRFLIQTIKNEEFRVMLSSVRCDRGHIASPLQEEYEGSQQPSRKLAFLHHEWFV